MKHIITPFLVVCLLLSVFICSCNSETPQDSTQTQHSGEMIYTSKYVTLPQSDLDGNDIQLLGDCPVHYYDYDVNQYYSAANTDSIAFFYKQRDKRSSYQPTYFTLDLDSGVVEFHILDDRINENGLFSVNVDESYILRYIDDDGTEKEKYNRSLYEFYNFAINVSGDVAVTYSYNAEFPNENFDPEKDKMEFTKPDGTKGYISVNRWIHETHYILALYRPDGAMVYETDITEIDVLRDLSDDDAPVTALRYPMIMTDDGYVGMIYDKYFLFFDPAGNYLKSVEIASNPMDRGFFLLQKSDDGTCYIRYRNEKTGDMEYAVIDFAAQTIGEPTVLPFLNYHLPVCFGSDQSLYYSDDINFYRYHPDGTEELLFNWTEMNLVGADIHSVYLRDEDSFTVVVHDAVNDTPELVLIDAVPMESVTPKTEIVIAAGNYIGESLKALQTAVKLFNRSNPDYTVTVDYYDPQGSGMFNVNQQIANDMANGKQIDLIVFHNDITMEYFDNLGILGDWYPLMDADDVYTRDAFLPCIRAAYETPDGRLPVLTTDFSLTTLVGSAELIGDRDHWTYEECLTYVNSLDWDEILLQIERPEGSTDPDAMLVLRSFLPMVLDDYIDEATGTCSIDSESFVEFLNLCAAVIIDHEVAAYKADDLHIEQRLYEGMSFIGEYRSGNTRLYSNGSNVNYGKGSISHPAAVLNLLVNFYKDHESLSFIGYPMPSENSGIGTAVTPMLQFGLTASAAYTDGAWMFMREYLSYMETREQSNTYENDNVYGLPCTYAALDALLDYFETREYLIAGGPGIQEFAYKGTSESNPLYYDADPRVRGILTDLLQKTTRRYSGNTAVMDIIYEEASAYYGGIRTIEETVEIMQSRVGIWLAEHVG